MDGQNFGEAKILFASGGAYLTAATEGTGAELASIDLNSWVAIVTLIFVLMQIGTLAPKYFEWGRKFFTALRDFLNNILPPSA